MTRHGYDPIPASVLAFDLARRTGWAHWDGTMRFSGIQDFTPGRGESSGMLWVRFDRWLFETVLEKRPWLLAYEQTYGRASMAAAEIMNGMSTRVQGLAAQLGIECTNVNGMTLKKWVTGRGNSKKDLMRSVVNEKLAQGKEIADDNEADAIAVLEYLRAKVLPR